ncbi:MAG TPA: 4Fe-4S dicluster domain-containing protein [Rectinemataceae bacterium]|nr:4Fe-4S dicluster domain-containing protein [Rectinemataceae bacterium]
MSRRWYPVIDYVKCAECGSCVAMCRHGVYDKLRSPTPVVIFPDGCVAGCKGCGNACPNEAIAYVGDMKAADGRGCDAGGCECGDAGKR